MSCGCSESVEGARLLEHLQNGTPAERFPLSCQWEITCRCNLKCVMCYTDCFNTPEHIAKELSGEEIIRIMNELKTEGVMELTLTGGEPMSHPDFKKIYLHAIQNGFLVTVFTNGTLIDRGWIDFFNQYPPTMFEISYHGAMESTFDGITQIKGSFGRVRKSIQLILEHALPLTLKATGMNINQSEILEIKKFAKSLEKVHFRFGQIIRPFANGDTSSYQYQLAEKALDEIIEKDAELLSDQEMQEKAQLDSGGDCHSGKRRFHIDAYGNLQLCSENRKMSYNLRSGNFKEGFYQKLPHFDCPMKNVIARSAATPACR